jgi:hypothetical protein
MKEKSMDSQEIQQVAAAVAAHIQPPVPVQVDRWDVATIARVIKRKDTYVRNSIICLPDFPKAIRLPTESGGRGQPLYKAHEVLAWLDKYQDKH